MSKIYGEVPIDFTCDRQITDEQFKRFKKAMERLTEEYSTDLMNAAAECGFEVEDMHPALLDRLIHDTETDDHA